MTAQFSSASSVEAPKCGRTTAPGVFTLTEFGKSEIYFPTWPDISESFIASSSTRTSREKFKTFTPSFIFEIASALIMCLVASIAGT